MQSKKRRIKIKKKRDLMALPNMPIQTKARTMGAKLATVCTLALLMTASTFFVSELVNERMERSTDVRREISKHVGGPQTLLGPTLAIPYRIPASSPAG